MSSTRKLVSPLHRFPGTLRPIAAAVIALMGSGAQATDTWVGPANGGYWDVAGNWTSAPAAYDAVATGSANTIYRTGTLQIYSMSGTGDLNLQGGTLRVEAASASFGGSLTMSGGTFSQEVQTSMTLGSLRFNSGTLGEDGRIGAVNVIGATTFDPAGSITVGTTLNLNGGATWAAGSAGAITLSAANKDYTNTSVSGVMRIAAGTTFADLGNLAAGQTRSLGVVSSGSINNYGTYTRSGLGTTNVQSSMYNAGVVNVDGGTLNFNGTFGVSGAGAWNIASGAALQLNASVNNTLTGSLSNNGVFTVGGSSTSLNLAAYSGTGSIAVTGGTLTVAGTSAAMAPGNLSIATGTATIGNTVNAGMLSLSSGGVLGGVGAVTAGGLSFGQGTMTGAGTTTVTGAATLDGALAKGITAGRTLNLNGVTSWTAGTTGINVTGTSTVVVGLGATFADQGTTNAGQTRQLGGSGNTAGFVNQGTYNRTGLGTTLFNAGFSNNGVLNLAGGAINVAGATSSSGQWNVGTGTTLTFSSGASDVHGGTFNNNGGTIAVTGGSLAVSGGGTSTGVFSVAAGKTLSFGGGTYTFNGGSFTSDGSVTLANGSAVNFGGSTHTINSGSLSNAGTLTVSAGNLNVGSSVNFSGAGTVNVTGGQLNSVATANLIGGTMNVSGGTVNLARGGTIGNLSITGGTVSSQYVGDATSLTVGTLSFTGGSMTESTATGLRTTVTRAATFGAGTETLGNGHQLSLNAASTWSAGNGSTIAIVGGNSGSQAQLNIGSGGTFADLGGGTRTLGGDGFSYVTNAGTYTRTGSGTTTATNSFTNAGTLNINGGTMAFAAGYDTFVGHNSTGTINIAAGATMQDDTRFSVSSGTVNNQGQLKVTAGTTTLAAGVSYGGNGTINVTGGALASNITGAITTGGIALTGGAATFAGAVNASSLAIAGGTLTAANNVTVATDYTNTGFGTGNGFDKRAGVSGAGLINGTNVAEAITGASVTNGTTGNATLTIGNVRVGTANSYAYQVANTGTGSTLRGAIQTTGIGVGVTDARLTGSGVTAGNFGPLAAGAISGDLAIGFTASTAGAIVLNGVNTIHVANDFGNVAEQNLAIVAGSGAAAYNVAAGSASVSIGNARVNTTLSGAITVTNTAATGAYSEDLDTSVSGTSGSASASGSLAGLKAGNSNGSALVATLDSGTAGAKTGTVTIGYTTAGKVNGVSNGLGTLAVGSQVVAVGGGVYNTAIGTTSSTPITIANQRTGGGNTRALTIANTATAGAFTEALNANFTAVSGGLVGSGSVTDLVAGGSIGNAMRVGVNTMTAGLKSGTVTIGYQTDGTGSNGHSGLAAIAAGAQTIDVSGAVYDTAIGSMASTPVVVANQRVGGAGAVALTVSNNASGGAYAEALNAHVAGSSGGVVSSGGVSDLVAGGTNGSALRVGVDTATAGLKSGTVTVAYQSDGTGANGHSGLAAIGVGSQTLDVSGAVYRLASPTVTTSAITAVGRVGGVAQTASIGIANRSADVYTEGLTVARGATAAGFTSNGSIANLVAGGSSHAIGVTLDTSTAGTFSGTQVLNYVSTGAGTTGAADLAIGSGTVALNGKVYATAVASGASTIDFGIVHVGDAISRGVVVTNVASGALVDDLVGAAKSASAAFSASGDLGSGLAAGQSGNALKVGIDTAKSGVYAGTAAFSLASHNADLSDAALADLAVGLSGTVDAYADDTFAFGSGAGTLTRSGSTFYLDFGTVTQGSGTRAATLMAGNDASGLADLLDGSFEFLDIADFGESGFASFADFGAGQFGGPLSFSFDALALGDFTDTIVLHGLGHNASGYAASLDDLRLVVRGAVVAVEGSGPPRSDVPEPASWMLLAAGLPWLVLRRARRAAVASHA